MLIGGKDEAESVDYLNKKSLIDKRMVIHVNDSDIIQTLKNMSLCDVVLSAECGFAHMADAVGAKTVVYKTVTDTEVFGPFSKIIFAISANISCKYCLGTERYNTCKTEECVSFFSSDMLVKEILKYTDWMRGNLLKTFNMPY